MWAANAHHLQATQSVSDVWREAAVAEHEVEHLRHTALYIS